MRQIAIVGNSHIAALKLGWDEIRQEFPDIEVTFFGAQAEGLLQSKIVAGFLVPQPEWVRESLRFTSNGQEAIRLRDYDGILVVGCRFGIFPIIDLYLAYRSEDHRNLDGATHLMSEALFRRMARDALDYTLGLRLYRWIRPACKADMRLLPLPMISEGVLESAEDFWPGSVWKAIVASGDGESLHHLYRDCLDSFAAADGVRYFEQPPETLASPLFTRHRYTVGSVRLTESFAEQHASDDFSHMNRDYGAILLRALLPSFGAEPRHSRAVAATSSA